MKSLALSVTVLFAASVMLAEAPAPATASPTAPGVRTAPGKATDPKVAPAKKEVKKEPVYTIPGTAIARPNGTFLGLQVLNNVYVLSFYDAKKKPASVDVSRGLARWPNPRGRGDYRTVLNSSGNALVGSQVVTPPYNFNIFITLLQGEGDNAKAVENYTVQVH